MDLLLIGLALVFGITNLVYFFALWEVRSLLTGLPDIRVDPTHPSNRKVLQHLRSIAPENSPLQLEVTEKTDIRQEAHTLLRHNRFDELKGLWSEAHEFWRFRTLCG